MHDAIRDWVLNDEKKLHDQKDDHYRSCLERMRSLSTYRSAPKYGHLLMALHIMRTLNSRTFQERHLFRPDSDKEELEMFQREEMYPQEAVIKQRPDGEVETCVTSDPGADLSEHGGAAEDEETDPHDDAMRSDSLEEHEDERERDEDVTDMIPDDISDAGTATSASSSNSGQKTPEDPDPQNDRSDDSDELRYDLTHWDYHIRMAEQQWSSEERNEDIYSEEWALLYAEVKKFMDSRSPAFRVWQKRLFPDGYSNRLYYAAFYGLVGVIKMFLKDNDDLSERNESGETPLHAACWGSGNYVGLEYILDRSVEWLNDQQDGNLTPAMVLVDRGVPLDKVEMLVAKGARLDLPAFETWYSLHYAIRSRSYELCEYILDNNIVSPSIKDDDGETPLHWLLKQDDASVEIANLLVRKEAEVCAEDLESQQPLYEAACTGNVAVARVLIQHGADVNDTEDCEEWTLLHKATSEGHVDFVRLLLECMADVTSADRKSRTPLHLAVKGGRTEILKMILDHLTISSDGDSRNGICDDRMDAFADWNQDSGSAGSTDTATDSKREDRNSAQHLAKARALEYADRYGNTPLHKAAAHDNRECVELLLSFKSGNQLHSITGMVPLLCIRQP